MKENNNANVLLIQQYLEGKLDPKRMHELEREALNDPFLADAIEGYSYTKKPVSHELSILQRQLEERIALQQEKKNYFHFTWFRLSVAAAAGLMFITAGLLFRMDTLQKSSDVAENGKVQVQLSPELNPGYDKSDIAKTPESASVQEAHPDQIVKSKAPAQTPYTASGRIAAATMDAALKVSDNLVQGTVTDTKGVPLSGVTVQLSGGTNVETDVKGEFILPDSLKGTINVARAGYKSQQLSLNSGRNVDIKLAPVPTTLNEVVVSTYGVQSLGSTSEIFRAQPIRGWNDYKKYIDTNLRYPQMEVNVAGDVIVGFTIDSQSRPTNIHIIQSLNALCNAEAIRLIRWGPDWEIVDPSKPPEVRVTVNFHP